MPLLDIPVELLLRIFEFVEQDDWASPRLPGRPKYSTPNLRQVCKKFRSLTKTYNPGICSEYAQWNALKKSILLNKNVRPVSLFCRMQLLNDKKTVDLWKQTFEVAGSSVKNLHLRFDWYPIHDMNEDICKAAGIPFRRRLNWAGSKSRFAFPPPASYAMLQMADILETIGRFLPQLSKLYIHTPLPIPWVAIQWNKCHLQVLRVTGPITKTIDYDPFYLYSYNSIWRHVSSMEHFPAARPQQPQLQVISINPGIVKDKIPALMLRNMANLRTLEIDLAGEQDNNGVYFFLGSVKNYCPELEFLSIVWNWEIAASLESVLCDDLKQLNQLKRLDITAARPHNPNTEFPPQLRLLSILPDSLQMLLISEYLISPQDLETQIWPDLLTCNASLNSVKFAASTKTRLASHQRWELELNSRLRDRHLGGRQSVLVTRPDDQKGSGPARPATGSTPLRLSSNPPLRCSNISSALDDLYYSCGTGYFYMKSIMTDARDDWPKPQYSPGDWRYPRVNKA